MWSSLSSCIVLLTLLLVGVSHGASSNTFIFDLHGGAAFCSQCGAPGAYACSSEANWPGTWLFSDSTRLRGRVVSEVQVTMEGGFGCQDQLAPVVRVSLNGVPVDSLLVGTTSCECGDCGGKISFSATSPYGWPSYQSGGAGQNNLTVSVSGGSICLSTIVVNVRYAVPDIQINTMYTSFPLYLFSTNNICGKETFSYLTNNPSRYSFNDPLPPNSILYSLDVWLFGTYFDDRTFAINTCRNASVVMNLNSFTLSKSSLTYPSSSSDNDSAVQRPCALDGCDGIWRFVTDKFYADGVPSYVYGGANSLAPTVTDGGNYQMAIAEIGLYLYYLPSPSGSVVLQENP